MIKIIIVTGMTTATIIIIIQIRSSSAFRVNEPESSFVKFIVVILVSAELVENTVVIVVAFNRVVVVDDVVTTVLLIDVADDVVINVLLREVLVLSVEVVAKTRLKSLTKCSEANDSNYYHSTFR